MAPLLSRLAWGAKKHLQSPRPESRGCAPTGPPSSHPRGWRPPVCSLPLCLVCSAPHLPASPVLHLVREPGWLAREHHRLEALRGLAHLPRHALPLPWLLAGAEVPGTETKITDSRHLWIPCLRPGPEPAAWGMLLLGNRSGPEREVLHLDVLGETPGTEVALLSREQEIAESGQRPGLCLQSPSSTCSPYSPGETPAPTCTFFGGTLVNPDIFCRSTNISCDCCEPAID